MSRGYCKPGVDGTTWPDPSDQTNVEWRLRYGSNEEKIQAALAAASFVSAYRALVFMAPRERGRLLSKLASKAGRPGIDR